MLSENVNVNHCGTWTSRAGVDACPTRSKMTSTRLAVCWALLTLGIASGAEFRVNDYGALGDGKTVDTVAIQRAIDAAGKARGTIVFAPGTYLTGSLFLKSGTHLRVDKGVEIRGVQEQ